MSAKEVVKAFYESDVANDATLVSRLFHKDCELHWTGSQGFVLYDYKGVEGFFEGTRQSYNSLRFEFTHFMEVNDTVVTRHTIYGRTIEHSDDETILAHVSSIWEIKDGKIFRCYEISQQADESNEASMKSYKEIKL
ncbi:SnoaL-like protein [Winogradskyella epiphytica]|uniref:SnoaL-like protein n=1 Tax=Winogradskyella epiphytica TaxID=262005 RepID=A0A2V4XJ53_9FLAO|nr:nuclear transport factor 2 family protein [Winogradskyella epiphytica]PYE81683.1 SnoaL-like protein [Winogradskyella epiphytica]GGW63410.1 hypothetical protein GCM10008085_14120 [Winogradskyella epiphytica]